MQLACALITATPTTHDQPWSNVGVGPKPLAPIANKPIIFHTLEALGEAGVREARIVAEPAIAPAFRAAVGDGATWGMTIGYVEGRRGGGICAALEACNGFADGRPLLVQRADALLDAPTDAGFHVDNFVRDGLDALAFMIARSASRECAVGAVGRYLLSPHAVRTLRNGPWPDDPLLGLRRRGAEVRTLDVDGCLACEGDETVLLHANRHALERLHGDVGGADLHDSEIQGTVVVHPTARLERTLVRGPAIIGAGARLIDSYVGPYTSVGAATRIEGTEIEHSIVMDGAKLLFVGSRLETSIIGRDANIVRRFDMPKATRLSIGDGAEVALS